MKHLIFALVVATAVSAQAENSKTISPEPPAATSSTANPNPAKSAIAPKLGIVSFNDSVRGSEAGARYLKTKQEIFAGAKHSSGWSLIGMMVQCRDQYSTQTPKNHDNFHYGDPSVRVGHPAVINNNGWVLDGQFRYYFPTTLRSDQKGINQWAYASNLFGHLGKYEVMNILIPRYFQEANYVVGDTKYYAEDRTQVGQKFNNWLRGGLGQYTQVEAHSGTPTGLVAEVYPYADFLLSKTVFFGPRVSFPVVARNSVFDGPKSVSTNDVYAELFLSASL